MAVSQLWAVDSSVQAVLTQPQLQYLTSEAEGTVAGLVHLSCTWSSSSLSAAVGSGYQTRHTDREGVLPFRKAHADQAVSSWLVKPWFCPNPSPILITVSVTSCSVFDGTSWQAYIETVCLRLTDEWQLSFICITILLCFLFATMLSAGF